MKLFIFLTLTIGLSFTGVANAGSDLKTSRNDYSCTEGVQTGGWPKASSVKINLARHSMDLGFNTVEAVYIAPVRITCAQLEAAFLNTDLVNQANVEISYGERFMRVNGGHCLKVLREDLTLVAGNLQFRGADVFTIPADEASCQ